MLNGFGWVAVMFVVMLLWALYETARGRTGSEAQRLRRELPARDPKPKPKRASKSVRDRRLQAVKRGLEAQGHTVGLYDQDTGAVYVLDDEEPPTGGVKK